MSINPFAEAATALQGQKIGGEEKDSLGGGFLLPTNCYDVTITQFYSGKFESGAGFIVLEGTTADGKKYRHQEITTNKAGQVTYTKDGEQFYLPGYNKMNSIAMLAARKELHALQWEEKQVKVWDQATKAEVVRPTPVAMDMIGKKITLGIIEATVNVTEKQPDNKYAPVCGADGKPLVRDENLLDKAFDYETKKTIPEFRAKSEKATFHAEWLAKHTAGVKQDRVKDKGLVPSSKNSGAGAVNAAGTVTQAPAEDLFG